MCCWLLAAGVIKEQRVEQVWLGSDPATAIGIGGAAVIKLCQKEMSVVVSRVELEAQAVEGVTEVIQPNRGLAGVRSYVIKTDPEGKAPANVSSPILNPEGVTLLGTLAQVVKTKGLVVPTGQQLVEVTERGTIGRVQAGIIQDG